MQATLGDPATLTSLTTYFRRACRGELPTIAAATFSSARMVALNKSRPGVRPIGVPLVLRRMAGRLFAVRFRDHWAARLTGCGGRVVNFAVGRKSGAQAKAVACQELLAANPHWGATLMDVRAAFQYLARAAIAEGIAGCPENGGREVLAFFLLLHRRNAELTCLAEGEPHIILHAGLLLGHAVLLLGLHGMLCKAHAAAGPDCTILAIADDVTIIGPHEQRHAIAAELMSLYAANKLEVRVINDLSGAEEEDFPVEDLKEMLPDTPTVTAGAPTTTSRPPTAAPSSATPTPSPRGWALSADP